MTADIEIKDSTLQDVRDMRLNIRKEDDLECSRMGLDSHKAVYQSYRQAIVRKSAFIDGRLAAMWGVVGTPLSLIGRPYFITTYQALKASPISFARTYKKQVQELQGLFPLLENYVDATYTGAVKLLELAGFSVDKDNPIQTPHGDMFYKYSLESQA